MDKQELIKIYKERKRRNYSDNLDVATSRRELFDNFIADLESLEEPAKKDYFKELMIESAKNGELQRQIEEMKDHEPQKIKVPEFVAKWFETNKYVLDRAILDYMFEDYASDDSEFGKWFDNKNGKPIETLVRMLDGYEVEEEPKYEVDFGHDTILYQADGEFWIEARENNEGVFKQEFTEKEIKSIDERYWPFAVPAEEVAEG